MAGYKAEDIIIEVVGKRRQSFPYHMHAGFR